MIPNSRYPPGPGNHASVSSVLSAGLEPLLFCYVCYFIIIFMMFFHVFYIYVYFMYSQIYVISKVITRRYGIFYEQ